MGAMEWIFDNGFSSADLGEVNCMQTETYQVRMPQLVAAFMPMITTGVVMSTIAAANDLGKTRVILACAGVFMVVVGIMSSILMGIRKKSVVVAASSITVWKTDLGAGEIFAIRIRKTMVDIVTAKFHKRATFAFQKRDIDSGVAALKTFATRNDVKFELK